MEEEVEVRVMGSGRRSAGLVPGREEKRPTDEISGARQRKRERRKKGEHGNVGKCGNKAGCDEDGREDQEAGPGHVGRGRKRRRKRRQQRRSSSSTARQAERY